MVLFLDSGVGGLVYLEEFQSRFPGVPCCYVADTAFFPYGSRSPRNVRDRLVALVGAVLREEISPQVIVVACNTASVVALEALRRTYPHPFVGVVPAVKPAAARTRSGHLALLATLQTTKDPYTDGLVKTFARYCRVSRLGLPGLVQAAEESFCSGEDGVARVIEEEVVPCLANDVDTVVLACTHFVRYRHLFSQILGPSVAVVDSLEGVVQRIAAVYPPGLRQGGSPASEDKPFLFHTSPLSPRYSCIDGRYRVRNLAFLPTAGEVLSP
ncbi:glutamate racemase [Alkalispirochaeta americana]|uniref:Glutamate racemase n=1 Tax=Alkalispirochaeta americana TaxID=159291 RepID=A0A1N6P265_9SPIO|nr:glutamate racemase [Alkalispirochaeta americana]SIP98357.1 glutamate racemase [Alkalispirochaeta americana]